MRIRESTTPSGYNFSGPVRLLMKQEFDLPVWKHQNGIAGCEDWEAQFQRKLSYFNRIAMKKTDNDTQEALALVFERLYVLRNQLVHGGATWNSKVNRSQVRDGAAILAFLVPVFVDVMMNHPAEVWAAFESGWCPGLGIQRRMSCVRIESRLPSVVDHSAIGTNALSGST